MRLYPDPLIALSVEKKGVDAVRRVSLFRSVTVSVTLSVPVKLHNKHKRRGINLNMVKNIT